MNNDEENHMEFLAEANVRMVLLTDSLQNIRKLEREIYNSGDVGKFYSAFIQELAALTNSRCGVFLSFLKDGSSADFVTTGFNDDVRELIFNKDKHNNLLDKIYETDNTVILNDFMKNPDGMELPQGHPEIKTFIAVRLKVDEKVRAVLYLTDKTNDGIYNENDELLIKLMLNEIEHICEVRDLLNKLSDKNIQLEREKSEQALLLDKINEIQNQLLQSEKMASIGQLAAGVAHEINNPVGYINSNITSLTDYVNDLLSFIKTLTEMSESENVSSHDVKKLKQDIDYTFIEEDIGHLLSESKEGVHRVKKIVQDLKDFSHVDEEEWQWTDLHKGIDSTLNVVNNEIKYKAEVIKEYGDIPDVECIASQLNQVFMNLLVNAAHSIETQGTITIRTEKEDDEHIRIQIVDTGKGIKEENVSKLYEPFFTTKPVGQGTGLGLSLSYGIITKHGGKIDVESEVGKGTTFTITLPVKQKEQHAES